MKNIASHIFNPQEFPKGVKSNFILFQNYWLAKIKLMGWIKGVADTFNIATKLTKLIYNILDVICLILDKM